MNFLLGIFGALFRSFFQWWQNQRNIELREQSESEAAKNLAMRDSIVRSFDDEQQIRDAQNDPETRRQADEYFTE